MRIKISVDDAGTRTYMLDKLVGRRPGMVTVVQRRKGEDRTEVLAMVAAADEAERKVRQMPLP